MRVPLLSLVTSLAFATSAWGQHAPVPATEAGAATARVRWMRGRVDVEPGEEDLRSVRLGEVLSQNARVSVGDGAIELALHNGTVLTLEDHSRAVLFASPLAPPAGLPPSSTTTLLRGAARVRMASAQVGDGAQLIPLAAGHVTVFVGRADGLVTYDTATRIVRLAANRGRLRVRLGEQEYILRAGNGSVEEPGHPRQPYRQLPPQPVWLAPPPARILSSGEPVDVSATYGLRGSTVAAAWRVELARDEAFHDLVTSARQAGAATTWSGRALEPGRYHLRVTALDHDGFESLPSAVARFHIAAPHLIPGVAAEAGDAAHVATLRVPDGFFCGIDGARPVATNAPLQLTPGRSHRVRCSSTPGGAAMQEFTVPAAQSGPLLREVRIRGIGLDQGVLAVRLFDAERRAVPYAEIAVTNDRGVLIDTVREARERGVYNASVRWPQGVRRARFRFTVNGAETFEEDLAQGD